MHLRRILIMLNILAVLVLILQGGSGQIVQASSLVIMQGTFITLWGDGTPESGESRTAYFLATSQMDAIRLFMDSQVVTPEGGLTSINRQSVVVQGTWLEQGSSMQVQSISLMEGENGGPEGVYGPQPWVSILCKFSDVSAEPKDLPYFQGMYSSEFPGLDHHWREQSYDLANLEGSGAYGWYVLPYPRSHYVPPSGFMNWEAAAQDCTAAADPSVDFSPYIGINLMFNDILDCCAWGGGWWGCLDGICKVWSMTWEPPWGYENVGVIAHETGHGFGLPHSSGNYGQTYDNQWDVMSDLWSPCGRGAIDPVYGCLGQHTISYHKDLLGWIDPAEMSTVEPGNIRTISLERLAQPQSEHYLAAFVPVEGDPSMFLTVEARQLNGYDSHNPGQAVIIHEVVPGRDNPAHVIDIDQNGNTGDAGAMWIPGETYLAPSLGIAVSVLSATETGYVVRINNHFTIMDQVAIVGASQGYIGESLAFTATVSPVYATTPITYTWEATDLLPVIHSSMDDTSDGVDLTWDEPGTKTITVTASNMGGAVMDTHLIEVGHKIPLVSLDGPVFTSVGAQSWFTATIQPPDVAQPVTYTWQASGQMPVTHTTGISDSVSFTFYELGTQVITVTAGNIFGSTSDHYSIPVLMPPSDLQILGPTKGELGGSSIFTATVSPITTTVPITYQWIIDGEVVFTHPSGLTDSTQFSWNLPGVHTISVTAFNPVGLVSDARSIEVFYKVYLPIGVRN